VAEVSAQAPQRLGGERLSFSPALRILAAAWKRQRALFATGLLGLALGLAGALVLAAQGRFIAPTGDLTKPIAFNVALGIFLLTLAALAPLARFSTRFYRRWCGAQVVLTLGSFAIANMQTYRGIDPRFPQPGVPLNQWASILFGILALGGAVTFLIFAVRLFRRRAEGAEGPMILAARYGSVAALAGYSSGLWMILVGGSRFGEAGDILPLHALGFHGLQAVPGVAGLLILARTPPDTARRWIHVAGATWIGACAGTGWQALLGLPPLEPSAAGAVALVTLLAWGFAVTRAFHTWRCSGGLFPTPLSPEYRGEGRQKEENLTASGRLPHGKADRPDR
jgi:hypothetical protein